MAERDSLEALCAALCNPGCALTSLHFLGLALTDDQLEELGDVLADNIYSVPNRDGGFLAEIHIQHGDVRGKSR